jgi:hypothetical protein
MNSNHYMRSQNLHEYARCLRESLTRDPSLFHKLWETWNFDKNAPELSGCRKRLIEGEYEWAIGIFISEQDKFVDRLNNPTHKMFRNLCGVID